MAKTTKHVDKHQTPLDLDQFSSIFVKMVNEQSDQFGWNFHEPGIRQFILRLTGGCDMKPEYHPGLKILADALGGRVNGRRRKSLPQLGGYVLYGGTRFLSVAKPKTPIPGITEVPSYMMRDVHNARYIGVVSKEVRKMRYAMPYGLVIHRDQKPKGWKPGDDWVERFTVIHPDAKSILLLQHTVDKPAETPWKDEYKECYHLCDQAVNADFGMLLVAYNGGMYTGEEIMLWADAGWPVLLIKGSGRKCDELANDEKFLAAYPNVHVAEMDVESIRSKLVSLGALTPEGK